MTTGSEVRGISSPGQSGSARIAAGSGACDLDGQPEVAERVGGPGRDRLLGAGDARDPDERLEVRDQPVAIDPGAAAPASVSHAGSAGSCRSARPSR